MSGYKQAGQVAIFIVVTGVMVLLLQRSADSFIAAYVEPQPFCSSVDAKDWDVIPLCAE